MRFHVVGLPHTQTTWEYQACAFTAKVINFCKMMTGLGHEVILYSGNRNAAPCAEHIKCFSEAERSAAVGGGHFSAASFNGKDKHWQVFNFRVAAEIMARWQERDFVCIIGGNAQTDLKAFLPGKVIVEFGIGYAGSFADYRVFESYAWMHTTYGAMGGSNPGAAKGDRWFDAVVPGYFEIEKFPAGGPMSEREDYFFFIGRLGAGKGEQIAADVCSHIGSRLIVAGNGPAPAGTEHVGVIGAKRRGELMAKARAVFVPTVYIEPFGNVAVEAQACGTPVITTDWGAMTETVEDGVTGFRCRVFREFVAAAEAAKSLDPVAIRARAHRLYSLETIAAQYERYFNRLALLWDPKGWGAT
mgnify:CR=1 FL=1